MTDGNLLKRALISGAHQIYNQKSKVDELNVFPVPDGDTGTNMSMTAMAAAEALEKSEDASVAKAADIASSSMLRGARGNSGVILSLLFRGIAKALQRSDSLTKETWAKALEDGTKTAYKAVMNPTEGTILSVAKATAEQANKIKKGDLAFSEFFKQTLHAAKEALAQTPEQLPVLKKAGVVDAGGQGLVYFFEGMSHVFEGKDILPIQEPMIPKKLTTPAAEFEGEINFTYCTEFIINFSEQKHDPLALRAYLESIGDCVVVVHDEDIIKVHTHTNDPGNAIQEALKYGYLTNIKIDNMRIQHQNKAHESKESKKDPDYQAVDKNQLYGFVAVASGEGIENLFLDLGAHRIVNGGQTMNPSTQDILAAVQSVPAKTVFILPNNKNIIMAAEQVMNLADRRIVVLQTKSIPEGIAALLAFNPEENLQSNCLTMTKAFNQVTTGMITFAARDSMFDGKRIKKDEILGINNKKILIVDQDPHKAAARLIRRLLKSEHQFITVYFGKEVTEEESEKLYNLLLQKYENSVEINMINGGQAIYHYIISIE